MNGTDISAPETQATLGGRERTLRFDHNAMRLSEIYYQYTTRKKLGYLGICDQALSRTYIGLGAIAYGAAASAEMAQGRSMTAMQAFDEAVSYGELLSIGTDMMREATAAIAPPDAAKKA